MSPSRPGAVPAVDALVRRLVGVPGREDRLRHLEVLPAREAVHEDWPDWVPDDVRGAYAAQGVGCSEAWWRPCTARNQRRWCRARWVQ